MNYSFEMNNAHQDTRVANAELKRTSPVFEVFSAMVSGKPIPAAMGEDRANKSVAYVTELASRASNGDNTAIAELNQLRRMVIEPLILEEAKAMELFGTYEAVGLNETIEREYYTYANTDPRIQAMNGPVKMGVPIIDRYTLTPVTISGGYAVDYRAMAGGDMDKENRGLELVKTQIMNNALAYVMKVVYDKIKNATGVKYWGEASGITKATLDGIVKNVRRFGKTSIVGAYAVVSQLNAMVGWSDGAATPLQGISDAAMDEIRRNGLIGNYMGSIVREVPAMLNPYKLDSAGTNYEPIIPEGLLFVVPTGIKSPIATYTQGGLTTFTGNDVSTGKILTRFDLNVAADVAKGHEYEIGLMNDTAVTAAANYAI